MGPHDRVLITAALPYANGNLHVGHIGGSYLPADTYARYCRSAGREVLFICGSDDHGVPATLTARTEGCTPREVVTRYHEAQVKDFQGLGIRFDIYGSTSSPQHAAASQEFFLRVHRNGFLEKRRTKQLYDAQAGIFLPDRYVTGTCPFCGQSALGDQCEHCGKDQDALELIAPRSAITGSVPQVRETTHWYFRQDLLEGKLREWLAAKESWRAPVQNFALGMLKQGLKSRAITRDLSWGVPVPLPEDPDAEGKVLYVWFDAPIGYVTFTADLLEERGQARERYADWWKNPEVPIYHFIGEDNIVFHALMWPAMLMAEGTFQLPANVVANCFVNFQFPGHDEEKMSKSRGTAVWIHEYLRDGDPDPLRYYLTFIAPEAQRTAFKPDDLARRTNDELVGTFGNFIHRTLTFAARYFDGKVPEPGIPVAEAEEVQTHLKALPRLVGVELDAFRLKSAMGMVMDLARMGNRFFDYQAPWKQRKEDPARCATTLHTCLHIVKALAILSEPFMPFTSEKAAGFLGLSAGERGWAAAATPLEAGRPLGAAEPLFRKIE
ncbi:MAG: methionine--tRNA ligase [Candidatus Eisenbacteria bacterium]|jgi:methionyl-tRNA synthetase|nr:methionine--tRNA ligase [Candidatus Eisenbacteria bacterium]